MPGTFHSRTVDQPIRFHDATGGITVSGQLESVKLLIPDAGPREVVLVVWFDYWTFRRIDRAHYFGYTFESIDRDGFSNWELSSDQRVQMELRVEGAALATLDDVSGDALLDRVLAGLGGEPAGAPLLDVGCYRYLAVYRQQQMGAASYLTGFTSVYRTQP